jgi:CSLREA domain-containing protein
VTEKDHDAFHDATARWRAAGAGAEPDPAGKASLAADFVINSSADPGDGVCDATECTLREAIAAANSNGQADTITFDEARAGGTIFLSSGELTIANDTADPDLTIDGDLDHDSVPDITVDVTIPGFFPSHPVPSRSCRGW